jgi:hypothetical protein
MGFGLGWRPGELQGKIDVNYMGFSSGKMAKCKKKMIA